MNTRPTDLFRPLGSIEAPDQWGEIEHRVSQRLDAPPPPRRHARTLVLAAVTLLGTFGMIAFLVYAFRSPAPTPGPATPPPAVVADVALEPPTGFQVAPHGQLYSMVEASGSLWVLGAFDPESGETSVRRIDPTDGSIQARIRLPFAAAAEWGGDGLIVGGGYVWGTGWEHATIYRIDPTDSSVKTFHLEGTVVSELAYDRVKGQLWAVLGSTAETADEGASLVEIDPVDGSAMSSTPFKLDWSSGLLPTQDTVWILGRKVSDQGAVQDGFLHQILPGSVDDVATGGSFALPVTDGKWIWTTASGDDTAMNLASGLAQIDPADGSVVDAWNVRGIGYDIAVGPDGGVWFLGAKGLERLNPSTGDIDAWSTPPDSAPTFIVPTSAGVWVGTYEGALEFRAFKPVDPVQVDPTSSSPEASADSRLIGPAWELTAIGDVSVPDETAPLWVTFGAAELSGSDGCGDLTASYRVTVDPGASPWANLSVGSIGDSTTTCGEASADQRATAFRAMLADAADVRIEGDVLTIRSALGALMFIDPLALDCELIGGGTSIGDTSGVDPEGAVRLLVDGLEISDRIEQVRYASQGVAYLVVRNDRTIAWAKVGSGPDGATRVEFDACDGTGLSAASPPT